MLCSSCETFTLRAKTWKECDFLGEADREALLPQLMAFLGTELMPLQWFTHQSSPFACDSYVCLQNLFCAVGCLKA